ncbi:MAG TPA: GGDEF domain-containing protein [Roseateles sp.]|nr:GGDEF domain-containing protein [Roseateles sp.]HWT54262.1 GGDEF domain-containing protein [Rhodocyclaceae bacterium]
MNDIASLFSLEESLAEQSQAYLTTGEFTPETRAAYTRLLEGYGRLLRETKQLIRLSDRKENELNRLNHKLRQLTHSLSYQAEHDAMTGCLNKGAMVARIERHIADGDVCLALLDIDHFKQINDVHGHPAGDAVLRGIAAILNELAGDEEWIGRMGGEEFAVLMPQRSLLQGRAAVEHMRREVEAAQFDCAGSSLQVTLSAGVAVSLPGEHFDTLYQRVDTALYDAKKNGRNCVVAQG